MCLMNDIQIIYFSQPLFRPVLDDTQISKVTKILKENNKKWFTGGELKNMIDATSQCNLIRNVRWLIKDGLVSKKRAGKQVYYRWNNARNK